MVVEIIPIRREALAAAAAELAVLEILVLLLEPQEHNQLSQILEQYNTDFLEEATQERVKVTTVRVLEVVAVLVVLAATVLLTPKAAMAVTELQLASLDIHHTTALEVVAEVLKDHNLLAA